MGMRTMTARDGLESHRGQCLNTTAALTHTLGRARLRRDSVCARIIKDKLSKPDRSSEIKRPVETILPCLSCTHFRDHCLSICLYGHIMILLGANISLSLVSCHHAIKIMLGLLLPAQSPQTDGSYHMPSRAVARQPFAVRSQLPDLLLFRP